MYSNIVLRVLKWGVLHVRYLHINKPVEPNQLINYGALGLPRQRSTIHPPWLAFVLSTCTRA